ncbi:MAG: M23 family metallopeptidase [Clostridia bacterium]|nr:M23 family metallopeptidase [Clostridia bacterium]
MDLHGHFHGYRTISSPFGKRNSPTKGASSYHSGIDIPAPPGTNIFSVESGVVILAKFNGSGGCTVIISASSYQFIYCHVSPSFLVYQNQYVKKGDLIAQVGPKNIYGFSNNPYKDSNGNPTNGATTGPHLHFTIKKDGTAVNPLNYF